MTYRNEVVTSNVPLLVRTSLKPKHYLDVTGPSSKPVRHPPSSKFFPDPEGLESNTNSTRIKIDFGVSPIGPPDRYQELFKDPEFLGKLARGGQEYPQENSVEQAVRYIKAWHELDDESTVICSVVGANEIQERALTQLVYPRNADIDRIDVIGFGPQYPYAEQSVNRHMLFDSRRPFKPLPRGRQRVSYETITTDIFDSYDNQLQQATKRYAKFRRKNLAVFVGGSNVPAGDVANPDTMEELIYTCNKKGQLVIVDEDFHHAVDKSFSVMKLTKIYKNLLVYNSLSKIFALPGVGFGYAVMHKEFAEHYQRERNVCDLRGFAPAIACELFNPDVIEEFLRQVGPAITAIKLPLMQELRAWGFNYLPTNTRIPILHVFDDQREGSKKQDLELHKKLSLIDIITADGAAFSPAGTKDLSFGVRMSLPHDIKSVIRLVTAMDGVIHSAKRVMGRTIVFDKFPGLVNEE